MWVYIVLTKGIEILRKGYASIDDFCVSNPLDSYMWRCLDSVWRNGLGNYESGAFTQDITRIWCFTLNPSKLEFLKSHPSHVHFLFRETTDPVSFYSKDYGGLFINLDVFNVNWESHNSPRIFRTHHYSYTNFILKSKIILV
jgi:hypothetical protein